MGFLRRIGAILGFLKDEAHANDAGEEEDEDRTAKNPPRRPTKGFSVQVPVSVERPHNLGPVLVPCNLRDGGVQGFRWYAKKLRIDEDGDVADEFLDEVLPEISATENQIALPRFEVKYSTRPATVRKQIISNDGNIRQNVEYQGMLQWV